MIRLNLFMIWLLHFLSLLSVICRYYRQNSSSRIIVVLVYTVSTPFLFIIHRRKQVSVNILIMTKMQYNGEDPQLSEFFVILIVLVVIGIAAWLFS